MPFVKFTEKGRAFAPKATLSRSGMLSMNDGAYRRFEMDQFEFCVLYYDPETRRVGIELIKDPHTEGARKLRRRQGGGADISAKSFCDFFEISVSETTVYPIQRSDRPDEGEILTIDLTVGVIRNVEKTKHAGDVAD